MHESALALRAWFEYGLAVLLALALAVLAACGRPASSGAGPGGTLVVAGPADLDRANPLVTGDAMTQEVNRFLLFMPLVRYAADLSFEPYLAETWTVHGDTAITFHLRDDVFWHDGRRTSAYDVAFTFTRALDAATTYPNTSYLSAWLGVEAPDSSTVRVRFRPHADPLSAIALLPVLPAHLLEGLAPEALREAPFNRAPVGNGPFRFVSQTPNDRWIFEANPTFPAALGGRPRIDRIVWRAIPDRQAQITELRTGNADLVLIPPAEQFEALAADPALRGVVRPSFKYVFIGWNGRRAPFGDARVRRALSMAIDRAEILTVLRAGRGTLAAGPVHPSHRAYDPALQPLPWDTASARGLLDEAGLLDRDDDGRRERADGGAWSFELLFQANNDYNRDMAEMIQADLAAVGVHTTPRPLDWNTLVARISSTDRDFDAVLMGWEADFRIDLRDLFHSSAMEGPFQLASYRNADVDALLDRAEATVDPTLARPLWHDVQRRLRDDQPWTFLYYYPDLLLARARLDLPALDVRGIFATIADWRLDGGSDAD